MSPVDFDSDANVVLLNPRMPAETARRITDWLSAAVHLRGHFFVLSSGTTATSAADYKWVALSKEAVLASAAASNAIFESTSQDIWFHTLPSFHVGGLAIWARAELSGARVIRSDYERWDAAQFASELDRAGATLTSLVPTQVHDLVQAEIRCPPSVRAILVGGGALVDGLYEGARRLGWPVLPSYGLSETASQAATEPLQGPHGLRVLPHLTMEANSDGRLRIRGQSLLTGYVLHGPRFVDPKDDEGWFTTEDYGAVQDGWVTFSGRLQDRIKIGGELSNLGLLRKRFDEAASRCGVRCDYALFALPDARLENTIALAATAEEPAIRHAIDSFDQDVLPFERVRSVHLLSSIPRTDLGKVRWAELLAALPSR